MRLTNSSEWQTEDLRALIYACARESGLSLKDKEVDVVTWRGGSRNFHVVSRRDYSGFTLKLAKPERFVTDAVSALASVSHDLPHGTIAGDQLAPFSAAIQWGVYYVNQRTASRLVTNTDVPRAWAYGLFLRPKMRLKKGRKVGAPLQEERLVIANARLAKWTRKLQLAKTKVRRYTREIKRRKKALAMIKADDAA